MAVDNKEQYNRALNALRLPRNKDPFPLNPPASVDYWADNKAVLQQMVKAQLDSIMFASSFIYVIYGPPGVGKTFAIKYLENPEVQKTISNSFKKPDIETFNFRVTAVPPVRTGELTFSLHRGIVEKCFFKISHDPDLVKILIKHGDFGIGEIKRAFKDVIAHINQVPFDGKHAIPNLENINGYKFLTQSKNSIGKLSDVNDLVEIVRILISIISRKYARVVISIDELENLSKASATERFLLSDFFRKMHENIEHDMTLFLVFTLDSFEGVNDLLQKAFLTRIKDRIEFSYVKDASTVSEYIFECISKRCNIDPYSVITAEVITKISESLIDNSKGHLTFRMINSEMIRLFVDSYILAGQPDLLQVDLDLYNKGKHIISSNEVVKQLTEWQKQGGHT